MRVYVIRHGESETNRAHRWTGWLDAELTEKGKEDAKRAGELLRDKCLDRVLASDRKRAMETAKLALGTSQCETSPLFREIHVGSLENQPISSLSAEQKERLGLFGYSDYNGESREEFNRRVRSGIQLLEGLSCDSAAVFTHAGWMRAMLDAVLEIDVPRKHLCCNNCTVGIFDYQDGIWRLHSWINLS